MQIFKLQLRRLLFTQICLQIVNAVVAQHKIEGSGIISKIQNSTILFLKSDTTSFVACKIMLMQCVLRNKMQKFCLVNPISAICTVLMCRQ